MIMEKKQLPSGWCWEKLGEICELATGGTPTSGVREYYEGGSIKWLVSGDIHQGEIFDCPNRITELGLKNSNAKYLPVDSVLIALNGQGKTRGTVAILRTIATCNQSLVAINPIDKNMLVSEYLYYVLKSMYQLIRDITGDKHRSGLSMSLVKTIEIPLPPLSDQKRIVKVLNEQISTVEKARKKAEEQLSVIEAMPSALFQKAFRGEI